MSSGQKVVLSFLLTLAVFAGFIVFDRIGNFNIKEVIQTKYYAQAKIQDEQDKLDNLAKNYNDYILDILAKIYTQKESYLSNEAVKTYSIQNPTEKDEVTRRNLTNQLFDEIVGFEGIRLIEKSKRAVHYSSFNADILRTEGTKKTYKNYQTILEENSELPVEDITIDNPKEKIYLDSKLKRLIISFPFFNTEDVFFGSFICYFNLNALETYFKNQELILQENKIVPFSVDNKNLLAINIPEDGKNQFIDSISLAIKENKVTTSKVNKLNKIIEQKDGTSWVLLASKESYGFTVLKVEKASLFELASEFSYLIYTSIFITLYLLFFLIFSLKRNSVVKIKQRIKKIQFGIVSEYLENKQEIQWNQVARQLANRKEELYLEIKNSIGQNKKQEKLIDEYLEQSWKEIINIINSQNQNDTSNLNIASIQEIRKVIEEVIQEAKLNLSPIVTQVVSAPVGQTFASQEQNIEDLEAVEELEEIEEVSESIEPLDINQNNQNISKDEEVIELEEFVDTPEDEEDSFSKLISSNINTNELILVSGANKNLILSREAFSFDDTDDFATCTSLFAEDLCIGNEYVQASEQKDDSFTFNTYAPDFNSSEPIEELEPMQSQPFSMTSFNQNNIPVSEDLEASAIVEENGVYKISNDVNTKNTKINTEFKKLADSVLNFKK